MSDLPPMNLEQIQSVYSSSDAKNVITTHSESVQSAEISDAVEINKPTGLKNKALYDSAFTIGVKAGMANQLWNIEKSIKKHERDLDTIYDFSHLLIQDRVIPPVLSEAKDIYTQSDNLTLRLSGSEYKIVSQAKFSSVPPNWRGYLTFPKIDVNGQLLNTMLYPKSSSEKEIWKIAIQSGWEQGIEQANDMLKKGMDRLNRDFKGMILFHTFVIERKISMPIIAQSNIAVTNNDDTMAVDESLLRITQLPSFNGKISTWRSGFSSTPRPVITPQKLKLQD